MHIASVSLFALVALIGHGASITVDDCPKGLIKDEYVEVFQDWCFEFNYYRRNNYDDANADCKINGGSLALVKSKEINNFLFEKIQDLVFDNNEDIEPLWIGVNDKDSEGEFVYEDGTNVTYTNWGPNEGPNHSFGAFQDCAAIGTHEGLWVDERCETDIFGPIWGQQGRPYICQYNAEAGGSSSEPGQTSEAPAESSAAA